MAAAAAFATTLDVSLGWSRVSWTICVRVLAGPGWLKMGEDSAERETGTEGAPQHRRFVAIMTAFGAGTAFPG